MNHLYLEQHFKFVVIMKMLMNVKTRLILKINLNFYSARCEVIKSDNRLLKCKKEISISYKFCSLSSSNNPVKTKKCITVSIKH